MAFEDLLMVAAALVGGSGPHVTGHIQENLGGLPQGLRIHFPLVLLEEGHVASLLLCTPLPSTAFPLHNHYHSSSQN